MGLVGACSANDADDDEPEGDAGQANEAGSGGTGGTEAGGVGGADAGSGGTGEKCQAQGLAALCDLGMEDCPENLESVVFICGGPSTEPKRWSTQCGGTAVSNPDWSEYVYFFNEQDELVGAQHFEDRPQGTCIDHGLTVSETFGTTCALQEPAKTPCDEVCPALPLPAWCDEHSCPSDADAARDCSTRPEKRRVWENDCGGVNVSEDDNGYGGTAWSFDAAGQLVGVSLSTDIPFYCNEQSYSQHYGAPCGYAGALEWVCGDDGTGGAGGASGVP